MKKLITIIVLALFMPLIFATEPVSKSPVLVSSSQIEGQIIDGSTGEALVGVTLKIKGSSEKIYTDLDGRFKISDLSSGTYDIDVNYVSYKGITLKNISTSSPEIALKVKLESVSSETK
ncbi:MAG: carboxypeptidase-like regulatory domain-containing protein [Bacteroidales bacterium]|jgi:hypothetical protein|nr:carboxypeptidase-like regulatory domain-containing protein [Bacteroidales bacterium]